MTLDHACGQRALLLLTLYSDSSQILVGKQRHEPAFGSFAEILSLRAIISALRSAYFVRFGSSLSTKSILLTSTHTPASALFSRRASRLSSKYRRSVSHSEDVTSKT